MLQNLAADFIYTVIEGRGIHDKSPLVARLGQGKQQAPTSRAAQNNCVALNVCWSPASRRRSRSRFNCWK
jgi:hypothetical protein